MNPNTWEEGFDPDTVEVQTAAAPPPLPPMFAPKVVPSDLIVAPEVSSPPPAAAKPEPDENGFIPIPSIAEVWAKKHRLKPQAGTEALPDLPGKPWALEECMMAQRFASEYIVDFNARNAWRRAGGDEQGPKGGYSRYAQHPYVQAILEKFVEEIEEEQLLSRKKVIGGLLKEAHYHGPDASHGGRIRAWMGLARIKKMDIQVTENHTTVRGGVMLIPGNPSGEIIDVDMWEKASTEQQLQLKSDVRK